jgi:Mlc titration factor MtfA (ptsG expression regulator)
VAPPAGLEAMLTRNVPLYPAMPAELRRQLLGHVNVFLAEKNFIGCGGQEINDEIRYTVAGTACILLLNREPEYFPGFTSILVYPDTFESMDVQYDGPVEVHERTARAGESWHRGPVVLSWGDVMRGVTDPVDGINVVLHEFAHKLDEQDSATDGLPELHDLDHYAEWAEVLSREYEALQKRAARGSNHVLDDYGLESAAEFFAVATESFFEKATAMRAQLPDLYEQLRRYYRVDPATWKQ